MPNTSPDNINYPDTSFAQNQPAYMATHASSVQAAFDKRQRYSYYWANATARTSQTGMTEGSLGYQVDTKTDYQYDNGAWRLSVEHAEFNATMTVNGATVTTLGAFSYISANTTSTSFVTPAGSGLLSIANPGLYAVSSYTYIQAAATARSFVELFPQGGPNLQRVSIPTGEDAGSLSLPNLRVTSAGQNYLFNVYQQSGATRTVTSTVRITRIA